MKVARYVVIGLGQVKDDQIEEATCKELEPFLDFVRQGTQKEPGYTYSIIYEDYPEASRLHEPLEEALTALNEALPNEERIYWESNYRNLEITYGP